MPDSTAQETRAREVDTFSDFDDIASLPREVRTEESEAKTAIDAGPVPLPDSIVKELPLPVVELDPMLVDPLLVDPVIGDDPIQHNPHFAPDNFDEPDPDMWPDQDASDDI